MQKDTLVMDTVFMSRGNCKKRGDFIISLRIAIISGGRTSLLMANKLKMIGLKKGDKSGWRSISPELPACSWVAHIGVVFVPILPRQKNNY